MSINADLSEAFIEHREAFGVPITFGAAAITAVVAESEFSRDLVEGGFSANAELQCKVLLSDLAALPSIGTLATYQATSFKVSKVAIRPGGLIGEYTLRASKR
jgi:hypothetical protein